MSDQAEATAAEMEPCPFCGSSASVRDDEGGVYVCCDSRECFAALGERYDGYAMPDHCFRDEETAIAAWNRRSSPAMSRPAPKLRLLTDIAHAAWHLCDDSGEDMTTGEFSVLPMDMRKLMAALDAAEEAGAYAHGEADAALGEPRHE